MTYKNENYDALKWVVIVLSFIGFYMTISANIYGDSPQVIDVIKAVLGSIVSAFLAWYVLKFIAVVTYYMVLGFFGVFLWALEFGFVGIILYGLGWVFLAPGMIILAILAAFIIFFNRDV